ncbi:hypothetical protein [Microbacterium sp. zg-YB36]|uniref:hypothetical protein n=1 Tax=Microbacterium sp. zg-YB36 TaxID=2969407 RepID=UPI00214AC0EA|nr:hypothetical protein [Microbacterium sp. zg-YB36]MDL5350690.1 hypothetical protein [Microbacterium sp. zg-YB36]
MRTAPPLITALGMAAAGLILAGWGGIVLIARRAGARTRSLITGFALAAGGPALIVVFVAIQDWYFSGDLPWMPVVVGVGLLCIVAGLATLLWTVVRAGVLPRWLGIVVVVSVVPGVLFNDQNAAVLLIVPFGLAMLLVGVVTYVSGAGSRKTAGAASLAHD